MVKCRPQFNLNLMIEQVSSRDYLEFLEQKTPTVKGRVGKFEKPARDTLFVISHGMLLTSR